MMTFETYLKEFNCIVIRTKIFLKRTNMVLLGYRRQMEGRMLLRRSNVNLLWYLGQMK